MKKRIIKLIIRIILPLLKRLATGKESFKELDKNGIHLMESSFYSPIPDLHELDATTFDKVHKMAGFDFNDKEQLKLLSELSTKYKAEYSVFPTKGQANKRAYYADNLSFPAQDGAVLHSMVRHYKTYMWS